MLWDGNLEFLGRIDSQAKIRGYRVELTEIEQHLMNIPGIKDAVVVDRKDEAGDKFLCAYVVLQEVDHFDFTGIKDSLSRSLPDYMIPSYIVPLDEIPLTPNGKVDRRSLPEPAVLTTGDDCTKPENEVQRKLAIIWSEVLGIENQSIGIHDNFFRLGGHSLRATIVVSRIHKELAMKIPLAEIFNKPTIKTLSEYISENLEVNVKYTSIDPIEKKEYYPQSSAQKRLFSLEQLGDIGTSYNMPMVVELVETFDRERYQNSINALIERHQALRTSFQVIKDETVQVVHDIKTIDFQVQEIPLEKEINENSIAEKINSFVRPFDLSAAPLLRLGFIRLAVGKTLLLYDIHHIAADGTSSVVINEDFSRLYAGEKLQPLKLQYKDFSLWQNRLFVSGKIKTQMDYWRNLFSGEIPRLNLPYDNPRPIVMGFAGDRYIKVLPRDQMMRFKAFCTENDVTLYMNLLCIFNVLLYKYSGQQDIVIGSGIAGRRHADLQGLVGMFVNTLPMRNYPGPEKKYREFLKEVKENCVKAFENQDMQFEELVYRLNIPRDPSRNPIFDVEFNVQNFGESPEDETRQEDVNMNEGTNYGMPQYNYENKTAKFDLILFATESMEGIHFNMEYSTLLFKPATIKKMMKHFIYILETVTTDSDIKLGDITISHDLASIEPEKIQTDFGF
jgi:acyl carrier protein